jgi:hypothetical protein
MGMGLGSGGSGWEQVFRDNEIDLRVLPELTADDLKEVGFSAIGHRRLLLKAIADLSASPGRTAPTNAPAAPVAVALTEAEQRQLTVMFCNLVGSTPLATRFPGRSAGHTVVCAGDGDLAAWAAGISLSGRRSDTGQIPKSIARPAE